MRNDSVEHSPCRDLAWPTHEARNAPATLPVGVLSERNGVTPASIQLLKCTALSVEYMTIVLSAIPSSSSLSSIVPTYSSWATITSACSPCPLLFPLCSGAQCVRKSIPVVFHHRNKGSSESKVSIRLRVSGPVFSIVWPPFASAHEWRTPPRTESRAECRVRGVAVALRLLLGIQMVEVAEELIESVHGRY